MIDYKQKYYKLIDKIKFLIIEFYKEKLISIVLFGSVGRNKFHNESDIDILIIVENAPKERSGRFYEYYYNVEKQIENDIQKMIKEGIYVNISPIIKSKEEVLYGSPLFIEMADECKILFDKDNFFHNVLSKLKDKLEKYKSVKVSYKGRYYWKLKPDYKWGDIINL